MVVVFVCGLILCVWFYRNMVRVDGGGIDHWWKVDNELTLKPGTGKVYLAVIGCTMMGSDPKPFIIIIIKFFILFFLGEGVGWIEAFVVRKDDNWQWVHRLRLTMRQLGGRNCRALLPLMPDDINGTFKRRVLGSGSNSYRKILIKLTSLMILI